ncbi:hypothetical protein FA95DRAFT_1601602 [Auriscalpium vulgare]|uniref:Uncharacterized protein n=1 Tax=Auriscalpium vulgare TaxID=40419 RepID=A0ACB8S7G2_9AGAM|nr:hypothetical protein FA95DRAFT_1601602 [Auriscalpium vulgare]
MAHCDYHPRSPSLDIPYVRPPRFLTVPPRPRRVDSRSTFSAASLASSSDDSDSSSPTSLYTPPSSVPSSPSPSQSSFTKRRPLPHLPPSPAAHPLPTPPAALRFSTSPRAKRADAAPRLTVLTTPPRRGPRPQPSPSPFTADSPASAATIIAPFPLHDLPAYPTSPSYSVHSISSPRVRPLPRRPPPPGPPSEGTTPVTLFGRPMWMLEEDDAPAGQIDWALIDEVMERAS